jgi:hypothetical protein
MEAIIRRGGVMAGGMLERLKRDRFHVAPRAVELSSVAAQRRYPQLWAPLQDLVSWLRPLPDGLLRFWLKQPGGHVVVTHLTSHYEPGEGRLKNATLRNVAHVSASDLAEDPIKALVPIGSLLDHLLGSAGAEEGVWLSQGGGVHDALQELGLRVVELFPLGHGFDEAARADIRSYLARSVALYLQDRRRLNAADPLMERLLRASLLSDNFWRSRRMEPLVNANQSVGHAT